ncbi:MAG: class I SAM-dependent methyltransferase family protein [Candidatus Methanomethylicaceae archaeon]|jgi:tRNA (guanine37-N1)-methyltransferase
MPGELSLKVGRKHAEEVRRAMIRNCVYDRSRKILAEGEAVFIPVLHSPKPEELVGLEGISFDVVNYQLEAIEGHPKDLQETLKGKIPQELSSTIPRSYDLVGDIVILEFLPPELAPYKREIGDALLRLTPSAKTALLKTGKVEGEYRVPQLEVIAGEGKFETIHMEYGVRLKVDLSKAYFSPRLGFERYRVSASVSEGETVVDMFAGVGPFSILIASKTKARVFAIDINPDAVRLLQENIRMNRLQGEVLPACEDVRKAAGRMRDTADHVIMNLPSTSLEFLDTAAEILKKEGGIIHIYMFAPEEPMTCAEKSFRGIADKLFGQYEILTVRVVKAVAPKRWQVALDVRARKK